MLGVRPLLYIDATADERPTPKCLDNLSIILGPWAFGVGCWRSSAVVPLFPLTSPPARSRPRGPTPGVRALRRRTPRSSSRLPPPRLQQASRPCGAPPAAIGRRRQPGRKGCRGEARAQAHHGRPTPLRPAAGSTDGTVECFRLLAGGGLGVHGALAHGVHPASLPTGSPTRANGCWRSAARPAGGLAEGANKLCGVRRRRGAGPRHSGRERGTTANKYQHPTPNAQGPSMMLKLSRHLGVGRSSAVASMYNNEQTPTNAERPTSKFQARIVRALGIGEFNAGCWKFIRNSRSRVFVLDGPRDRIRTAIRGPVSHGAAGRGVPARRRRAHRLRGHGTVLAKSTSSRPPAAGAVGGGRAAAAPKAVASRRAVARGWRGPVVADANPKNIESLLAGASLVLDATDNLETHFLINDACVKNNTAWVAPAR